MTIATPPTDSPPDICAWWPRSSSAIAATACRSLFCFKQKTAYEFGLGIPAEPLFRSNGCGRPGRAPERFLPLDITSLLLHVIFDARFLLRQSERQCFLRVHAR